MWSFSRTKHDDEVVTNDQARPDVYSMGEHWTAEPEPEPQPEQVTAWYPQEIEIPLGNPFDEFAMIRDGNPTALRPSLDPRFK